MEILIIGLVFWACMIALGTYVAAEKGRSSEEGVLLPVLFGPFGVLILALLPSKAKPANSSEKATSPRQDAQATKEAIQRYHARIEAERKAEEKAIIERNERRRAERDRKRIERRKHYMSRGITPGPFAWIEDLSLSITRWYKDASDVMQMFIWAICFSIPAGLAALMFFRSR